MDVEALTKRLRDFIATGCECPMCMTTHDAAAALAALSANLSHWEARAKELERERDWQRGSKEYAQRSCTAAEAHAAALESEREHQDFRLQNDREWKAKVDHQKARATAAEARATALAEEVERLKADIRQFADRLGPRWFLEQGWFPSAGKDNG